MNSQRKKAEELIYNYLQILDNTGTNTAYYMSLFKKMNDTQFRNWCKRPLAIRFHQKPWVIEPTMNQIKESLDFLGVPLTEKIAEPFLYENSNGEPVWSKEAIVIYIHIKKMKQFIVKKNNISSGVDVRDYRTGLLTDKGGKTSDRELEGLIAFNMDHTMKELTTFRADYMNAKNKAYSIISNTGHISENDIPIDKEDSSARRMLNYYLLGAGLDTNILNKDGMLPYTIKDKTKQINR